MYLVYNTGLGVPVVPVACLSSCCAGYSLEIFTVCMYNESSGKEELQMTIENVAYVEKPSYELLDHDTIVVFFLKSRKQPRRNTLRGSWWVKSPGRNALAGLPSRPSYQVHSITVQYMLTALYLLEYN
jgi:hypothetical protein